MIVGWACTVPAFAADSAVQAVVSRCHDSPGAPWYVLPLAWAGLAAGAAAGLWGGWQLASVFRDRSRSVGAGHALLCAVLPLAVVGALFQAEGVRTADGRTGHQHSACAGLGRPAPHHG
ncbi:hypothetical protein [Kitasatospora sp. DSM 101779]|uniref:hypothetical protein n=1 Tax=Kitasatospora sp. DSM 101779 TaxID=2853165 RepID=UPI0021D8C4FB|nr:hypothetical protein [Kitasatospora sp. DSM 101779]MCU7823130.1 hypothetical protein [Kitasatospora sp. DSM 101779]